jgi:hypothetical protein
VSYVVLDTDVASAIMRQRLPGSMKARLTAQSLAITFVARRSCAGSGSPQANQRHVGGRMLHRIGVPLVTFNVKDSPVID